METFFRISDALQIKPSDLMAMIEAELAKMREKSHSMYCGKEMALAWQHFGTILAQFCQ